MHERSDLRPGDLCRVVRSDAEPCYCLRCRIADQLFIGRTVTLLRIAESSDDEKLSKFWPYWEVSGLPFLPEPFNPGDPSWRVLEKIFPLDLFDFDSEDDSKPKETLDELTR